MRETRCVTAANGRVYSTRQLVKLLKRAVTDDSRQWIQVQRHPWHDAPRMWPAAPIGYSMTDHRGMEYFFCAYVQPLYTGICRPLHHREELHVTSPYQHAIPAHDHALQGVDCHPRGLCIVIVNFIDELKGFDVDVKAIEAFFKSINYDVIGGLDDDAQLVNLTASQLRLKLTNIVHDVNSSSTSCYNRLAVFVITSHGRTSYYSSGDITSDYSHHKNISPNEVLGILGQALCLLDAPKMLVMANCKSAETPSATPGDWMHITPPPETVVPARNTIIYESIDLAHLSTMLPDQGSWLIQTLVNTFRQSFHELQVRDLFCAVTRQIMAAFQANNAQQSGGYSLPSWTNTLCSRFFLG